YIKSNVVFDHITIYTVDGKKVMTEQLQNNQINVEQLSQSLYLATLVTDNGQEVNLKFVKI
ncbi:MAG TPA: T9SS type A sorting domain-containing protein, partial [Aquaticitalea sp.]|nr:T9SS type A sorting domain-containing protein [Aquaticitalea sp.]